MHGTVSRNTLLLIAFLGAAAVGATGATVRLLDFEALLGQSQQVVYGRVVSIRCVWDEETRTIWTRTELQVLDIPKGHPASSVVIAEPGGVMGNVGHLVPGVPVFSMNDEVVVFLYYAEGNRLRVSGLRQGVFEVGRDPDTGQRIVRPSGPEPETVFIERPGRISRQSLVTENNRLDQFLYRIRRGTR